MSQEVAHSERLTVKGVWLSVALLAILGASFLLSVFTPIAALGSLVFALVQRESLGRSLVVLYAATWVVFAASFWPFFGVLM